MTEWDDLDKFTGIVCRRLSALEALGHDAVHARRDELTRAWRESLSSSTVWVKGEAAWNLALLALADGRWHEVLELLEHADPTVRFEALLVLGDKPPLPSEVPPAVVSRLREISGGAPPASQIAAGAVRAWEFVQHGVDDLVGNGARDEQAYSDVRAFASLLRDEQVARLIPLLGCTDERLVSCLRTALTKIAQESTLGHLTCLALHQQLAEGTAPVALSAAKLLRLSRQRMAPTMFVGLEGCIADQATKGEVIEWLYVQAGEGADLSPVVGPLGKELHGPLASRASAVLGTLLRRTESTAVFELLMEALLVGSAAAGQALLSRSSGVRELAAHEAALRARLAKTQARAPLGDALVKLLVRIACARPDGLREWVHHDDLYVVGATCSAVTHLSAEPWFERLVAVAPMSFGAVMWLARWGTRKPDWARRVLAALPKAPIRGAEERWRELARVATRLP